MKTNKEKYQILLDEYNGVVQNHISYLFPNGLPKKIFTQDGEKINVKNVTYATIRPSFYEEEKPTRIDIEKIKGFLADQKILEVLIHYEYITIGCRATSAEKLSKIISNDRISFNPFTLRNFVKQYRKDYTLKLGDVRCSYCSKAVKESESENYTIIFPRDGRVVRETNKYCKGHGIYDQMGHEG